MANNVQPEVLVNSVLGKVADVLLNGDGETVPISEDHYVAFMSPGYPLTEDDFSYALEGFGGVARSNVDSENPQDSIGPQEDSASGEEGGGPSTPDPGALAADARMKYMRGESFYAMCDLIPDVSGIVDAGRINTWKPEARLSSVYALALRNSQVYDVRPDEETKEKIERWRGLLQVTEKKKDIVTEEMKEVSRESDLVKAYRKYMLAYLGELQTYNNLRISALSGQDEEAVHRFAVNGSLLQMRVRAAMADWSGNGYKGEYERINAAIKSVEGRSFALLKERYWEDFNRSILTNPSSGANFLYTAPTPATFADTDSGWSEFRFKSSDYRSNYKFESSETSAGGAFSIGAFSIGGSGSVEKRSIDREIDTETFHMTFKMCRVPIYRPWFHLSFLTSAFWRFDENNEIYRGKMISDGKSPPSGLMPAMTTECVFIKDLTLHFGSRHSEYESDMREASGRGGFSFGPFFAGGRHSSVDSERTFDMQSEDQGIRIPGLQLIGFICHTLPKAPDPDPDIPSDQWI